MVYCQQKGIDPKTAEESDVREFVDQNLHKADTMVGTLLSTVSVFYVWACNRNYCETNPAENVSLDDTDYNHIDPQTSQKVKILQQRGDTDDAVVAISPEDVQKIFEKPGTPAIRNELLLRLLYQTGVRSVELANVRLQDIDFGKRKIRITSAKADPGDENYIRYVYYHENLDFLMREWIEKQRHSYATAEESEYLFLTHQKAQMRPTYISRIVKEQAKEAGVNEPISEDANGNTRWLVTAHTLRHSMASHSANGTHPADPESDGIPVHMLAKILGHRKLDTTMKYVSTDWDQIEKVVQERGPR
ncbi:site-specific tyrosine recombinase [Halorubrum saccharovorum DSM 1137]|uniref:Site-specific tyrosine recombinase n=2 Tax=Halorubrum saccharovorum TaxID=2248 RepID=M0E0P3_9EURY|nr:site-specific tyrosine recombinase [Halorubrum saccharovorum DSM 1137]